MSFYSNNINYRPHLFSASPLHGASNVYSHIGILDVFLTHCLYRNLRDEMVLPAHEYEPGLELYSEPQLDFKNVAKI